MRTRTKMPNKGQSILEYAILISALAAVLITMGLYMQRSAQSKFRIIQDQINDAVR